MSRARTYASNAERQRAYRLRLADGSPKVGATPRVDAGRRKASRPQRLAACRRELEALKGEYEAWLDGLPEVFQDGDVAERLAETIEQMEAICELLGEIHPPKGFGRD